MESNLMVRCECQSAQQRDIFLKLLAKETRPILEDEVEVENRTAFNAIDNLDYPEWVQAYGEKSIHIMWWLGGWDYDEETIATLKDLMTAGAKDVYAYLSTEDDMHVMLKASQGKVTELKNWGKKELKKIADDDTEALFDFIEKLRDKT